MKISFTRRHNLRNILWPLGPAHQDDCTNLRHLAHLTGQDGQFVVPKTLGVVESTPKDDMKGHEAESKIDRTLLYLRISRTKLEKASSTLIRCLAEVSIKRQPKCLARSRPSGFDGGQIGSNVGYWDLTGNKIRTVHANLALKL